MYEDYYTRQVGGNLPFLVGARVQRGHGLGNLLGSLLRSAMPLIKRGALALGKRALTTGMRVAGDVATGQNVKQAVTRRAKEAGGELLDGLLKSKPPPPGRRRVGAIKRSGKTRRFSTPKRRRKERGAPTADIFTN